MNRSHLYIVVLIATLLYVSYMDRNSQDSPKDMTLKDLAIDTNVTQKNHLKVQTTLKHFKGTWEEAPINY